VAGAGVAVSPTGLPQPPQNLAVGSFSKPQTGHSEGNAVPHWAQKRRVAAFSARQFGQRIRAPLERANYNRTETAFEVEGRQPDALN
jgi:hypothetical protein